MVTWNGWITNLVLMLGSLLLVFFPRHLRKGIGPEHLMWVRRHLTRCGLHLYPLWTRAAYRINTILSRRWLQSTCRASKIVGPRTIDRPAIAQTLVRFSASSSCEMGWMHWYASYGCESIGISKSQRYRMEHPVLVIIGFVGHTT